MPTFVEPAYAYPTSDRAREFGRSSAGCHFVEKQVETDPPVAIAGPFDTREDALAAALATGVTVNPRFYRYHPETIVGHTWAAIQRAQQGGRLHAAVDLAATGDHGADPLGDGTFRMVPSGDVVGYDERCRRLGEGRSR